MAEYLSLALSSFLSIDVFLGLLVGVVGGMIIGIIPGLGPSVGIALLLPISFSMSPTAALVMMTAMYTTGVRRIHHCCFVPYTRYRGICGDHTGWL